MVKVAKTQEKDVDFLEKHRVLKQFVDDNQTLPTTEKNDGLYRFIARLRQKYRNDPSINFWKWRVPLLANIGIDITAGARISNKPTKINIEPNWRLPLNVTRSTHLTLSDDMKWFSAVMEIYKNKKGFIKQKRFATLQELMIKWLQVGDIESSECTRSQPYFDIRHTLSYVINPINGFELVGAVTTPTWRLKDNQNPFNEIPKCTEPLQYGNTVYFDSTNFDPNIFRGTITSLPLWMQRCYEDLHRPKDDGLVRLIANDERHFDHFPCAVGGTNWRHGTEEISNTKSGRPRRLNLYDKVEDFRWSARHKCLVQDGYSYTLSHMVSIPTFFGGRCIQDYPEIAKLKVEVWRKVWNWLSPLSKICPPNGVQCLLYVADFGGSINPHRDMAPNMSVDPSTNSQIIGTSVIVVSLFHGQTIQLGTSSNGEFKEHDSFLTDHCSVYVLDPNDDSKCHHTNKFEKCTGPVKDRPTRIRLALTFRWLGNRKLFFGPDNKAGLKYCQVEEQQYKFLKRKWKNSHQTQLMWRQAIKNKRKNAEREETVYV